MTMLMRIHINRNDHSLGVAHEMFNCKLIIRLNFLERNIYGINIILGFVAIRISGQEKLSTNRFGAIKRTREFLTPQINGTR